VSSRADTYARSRPRSCRPRDHFYVTRRNLIRRALLLLGIDSAGLAGCVAGRTAEQPSRSARPVFEPAPTAGAPSGTELSSAEVKDLVAFGESLVEGRPLTLEERGSLAEHLEYRTRSSPEYLSLYRGTAATLERLAGHRFAELEVQERIELIGRYRLATSRGRAGEDPNPLTVETRAALTRAVKDLIGGYYGSPAGWAAVGYDVFPGRCGELTRYTRPEG
jgi:hypothetical protein